MDARTTVVVVTWRGRDHIAACLAALAAQTRPHRTVVVDNASDDGTAEILADAGVEVLRLPVNAGYAGGLAAVRPTTPYTAWLNDDAVPEPDWLARLEDALDARPDAAAASAHLLRPDGATQSLGVRLTADGHGYDSDETPVFGFCGGAALLRTEAVGEIPADYFCYYEDTDTAWRMRLAGWDVISVPEARVTHAHGASTAIGSERFHLWNERNRLRTLFRCAPRRVAWTQLARFAALTAVLPLRRAKPDAPNFRFRLRVRVLAEVLARVPRPRADRASRARVWREWT
ncbi:MULTISPECIES: glycosyltransferase family 2 protein [Actinokineospora]|uniref:Glycosyl transferase n=1 Tax=Actinokineospora fastidiosa TaxID=1816 RepID=A0A918LB51_9PSEU|nr:MULTISPECIES: glycosyltransferase family 2 protein [Actinokineospora]UVS81766.1 mycofactocin system glycosyltransferase [Actinokineospora sp. UTMC 2448]GGS25453.1 glycosyl transferase [Actinokineospora fastidiosa]